MAAVSIGSSISTFGDSYIPSLGDAADIQVALKSLYFGSTGAAVTTSGIYGALYTLYTGNPTLAGNVTITGTLTVNGGTTTINSTTVSVDDKNIELGSVATPTNITADGGGITLRGTTDKTIIWDNTNANWTTSENWNLTTGKTLKINNVDIASGTGAALVVGGNASTTLSLGANGGTASILNPTVTLTNATVLNMNGVSPSIVTSSTGTASVFNTNALTVQLGGAATTLTMGATTGTGSIRNATVSFPNATAITGPATTAIFNTGSTNISAFGAATTLGIGNASGTTTLAGNLTMSTSGATLTLPTTTGTTPPLKMTSGTLIGTPAAGAVEFDGGAFYSTINTTNKRALVPSSYYYVYNSNVSTNVTASAYYKVPLVIGYSYEVEFVYFLTVNTPTSVSTTINFNNTAGIVANDNFEVGYASSTTTWGTTINAAYNTGMRVLNASPLMTIVGTADTTQRYVVVRGKGVVRCTTSGNFSFYPSGSSIYTYLLNSGSYLKVTPIGPTPATGDTSIGFWTT